MQRPQGKRLAAHNLITASHTQQLTLQWLLGAFMCRMVRSSKMARTLPSMYAVNTPCPGTWPSSRTACAE